MEGLLVMSCTLFYKGDLKENVSGNILSSTVKKHIKKIDCIVHECNEAIIITFNNGTTEPLMFDISSNIINNFFKWNGDDISELYQIFDLFIKIKPLFKSLKITDNEGLWEEYVTLNRPCKIQLRTLVSEEEAQLLTRAHVNSQNKHSEIEQIIISTLQLKPTALAIYHLIVQDFIMVMQIKSKHEFIPEAIVALTNEICFADDHLGKAQMRIFNETFAYMMLQIWISYSFAYKHYGVINSLPNNIRGLKSSKLAALFGISSIFLNLHSGIVNEKHAEMKKFAANYYSTGGFGEVMVSGNVNTELVFFLSMMDYLGFKYIGINKPPY